MHQIVYSGEGAQPVEIYAFDGQGLAVRPSSAMVQIVDLERAEDDPERIVLASTAATVDATTTTTTAAAGARESDPRRLAVASAAGFVQGRRYEIVGPSGAREAFELDRVEGLTLVASAPLLERVSFAVGSTVQGLRVSVDFPAGVANDAAQLDREDAPGGRAAFGADWTLEGVAGPSLLRTIVTIERRGKARRATREHVLGIDPQLAQAQHARGTIESAIREADEEIDALLAHHGYGPERGQDLVGAMAVRWRAVAIVYSSLGDDHEGRAKAAGTHADRWIQLLVSGRKSTDEVVTERATDRREPRRARTTIGGI